MGARKKYLLRGRLRIGKSRDSDTLDTNRRSLRYGVAGPGRRSAASVSARRPVNYGDELAEGARCRGALSGIEASSRTRTRARVERDVSRSERTPFRSIRV